MLKKYILVPLRQALAGVIPAAFIVGLIEPEKFDAAIVAVIFAFFIACVIWERFTSSATDKKAEHMKFFDEVTMTIIIGFATTAFVSLFVDDSKMVLVACVSALIVAIPSIPLFRYGLGKWLDKSLSDQNQ
ncbi:hypothetical protein [Alteromonas gilva]|uniref:Uncharacterized protein n=1 Tax=Alteromonas gilva TaxID=2987522 RepID=A0ABT5L9Y5_9ALTE|nr:hypothetical protein [Alteromonas gilva]MDC8832928.1 hypothetical protein [Alteromonas gilva]